MRYCVLASGSQANATLVEAGGLRLLIDIGVRCRTLETHFKNLSIAPESIDAILITHEHIDHVAGLSRFVKKYHTPVFTNYNTAAVIERQCTLEEQPIPEFNLFDTNLPFALGDLTVTPIEIPHDTAEPVGYLIDDGTHCLGYFTDLGHVTPRIAAVLPLCHALIWESNHDLQMLRSSGRGFPLIARISGRAGHLSNAQACEAIAQGASDRLRILTLAHLSRDCNLPDVAHAEMTRVLKQLNRSDIQLLIAQQNEVSPFMEL